MKNGIKQQYFATICANLITISYGISVGWTSPTIPILLSNDECPLEQCPLTNSQISWITSLLCIGGAVGSLLFGWLVDYIGRKISIILCGISQIISWLLILFGTNVYHLYISRLFAGLSAGAVFILIPIFVTEISEDRNRGKLGSILMLSSNGGILIGYIIGGSINYFIVPIISILFNIMLFIGFIYLPETPQYLIIQKRSDDAKNSLCFYRNEQSNNFSNDLEKLLNLSSSASQANCNDQNNITIKDFMIASTRKGILIGIILVVMTHFCGLFVILNYTSNIFKNIGSNLSPNNCAIIVGLIQFIGSFFSNFLVDRLGRKILLIISTIGTGIGLTSMGIYFYLQHLKCNVSSIYWLPILSLSAIVFFAGIGILPLPFVITAEIIPEKLKTFILTIFLIVVWIIGFLFVKYFNNFILFLEMYGCMWFFAICCFLESIFVIFILPETKGKSLETIQLLLK